MATQNKVSATLSAEAVTNINAAIATIRENLPFLTPLTKDLRKKLQVARDGRLAFVEESITFAQQNAAVFPASFNSTEYLKDAALEQVYTPLVAALEQLQEEILDTRHALRSDLYVQSLDVYAVAKFHNRDGSFDSYIDSVKNIFAVGPRQPSGNPE